MSADDSSDLSSPPTSEDEAIAKKFSNPTGIDRYFKPAPKGASKVPSSPPPPKRAPSPPHDYTLADNGDIAFIVMFRSRFHSVFPKSLPHYGPQDIERSIDGEIPGEHAERLLCSLLGLVLNRKKEVERGHFQRAFEEAVHTHQLQWPPAWKGKNPTHGGGTFTTMTPVERLTLLKTLILWSLSSSEAVQALIKESYKQNRREDDMNQPLSVQPWGRDGYKRRYWLIEGQDDTHFRVYRENNGMTTKSNQWFSVAGSIDEANTLADKLFDESTTNAKNLTAKIRAAVPRFEAGDEKRRRRDYRLNRKAAFARPEFGMSLYEGRTRGKKMRYTFSDEEDSEDFPPNPNARRSTRNNSGLNTPAEPAGPTVTASGRQVKSRLGGMYGETMLVDQRREAESERAAVAAAGVSGEQNSEDPDGDTQINGFGRPKRSAKSRRAPRMLDGADDDDDEDESVASAVSSGKEWSGNEDEPDAEEFEADAEDEDDEDQDRDRDENMDDDDIEDDEGRRSSLVVQLRYRKGEQEDHTGLAMDDGPAAPQQKLTSPAPDGSVAATNGHSQAAGIEAQRKDDDFPLSPSRPDARVPQPMDLQA